MAEHLSPLEIAGITILVTNAARQFDALMTAMVTPEQYDEVLRLRTTAMNAAKMARRALDNFVRRVGAVSK
jgi:transcription antitermination factor NusA-like protein